MHTSYYYMEWKIGKLVVWIISGYLYFPTPGLGPQPRPWPPICIYRPWPQICIYRPWYCVCIYRPWPPIYIYQPWPPMYVDRPWPKIIHLPVLIPKVYLLSQAPAIVPGLYLPVQVKILLLPQLVLLISLSLAPPPPLLLLLLLLLMIITTTKKTFEAAKTALNGL